MPSVVSSKPTTLKLAVMPKYPQNKVELEERLYQHLIPELGMSKARVVANHVANKFSAHYMKATGLYGYKQTRDLQKLFNIDV